MKRLYILTTIGLGSLFICNRNCKNIYCDMLKIMFNHKIKQLDIFKYKCSCTENNICSDCWVRNCNKNNF